MATILYWRGLEVSIILCKCYLASIYITTLSCNLFFSLVELKRFSSTKCKPTTSNICKMPLKRWNKKLENQVTLQTRSALWREQRAIDVENATWRSGGCFIEEYRTRNTNLSRLHRGNHKSCVLSIAFETKDTWKIVY